MSKNQVKGSMLLDYVRIIRKNKDKDWDKYLQPEDWDIINSRVFPMNWYPHDLYRRCGIAAFMLVAQGNLEAARAGGRISGRELFTKTYKAVLSRKDPMNALNQFVGFFGSLFSFSQLKLEKIDDNHAKIYQDYNPNDKSIVPYCYQFLGMLDVLIELTGGKNAKVELIAKQWMGAPETIFDIRWD